MWLDKIWAVLQYTFTFCSALVQFNTSHGRDSNLKAGWGSSQSWLQNDCCISCMISFHHIPSVFQVPHCNDLNIKGHDQGRRCFEFVSWVRQMSSIWGERVGGESMCYQHRGKDTPVQSDSCCKCSSPRLSPQRARCALSNRQWNTASKWKHSPTRQPYKSFWGCTTSI